LYAKGEVLTCAVETVRPFGIFVRLPDGRQGYIRRREFSLSRNQDPSQGVKPGDTLQAIVLDRTQGGPRVELSVRATLPNPWDEFIRRHREGDVVQGVVKSLVPRGAYIEIVPGVDGFIPRAELAAWEVGKPGDLLWIGDHVEGEITRLCAPAGAEAKLTLSVRRRIRRLATVEDILEHIQDRGYKKAGEDCALDSGAPDEDEKAEVGPEIVRRISPVLVVDSHSEVRGPLVEWLRRLGCAADGADSAESALETLRNQGPYGLALVDLDLPGHGGLDLVRAIRQADGGLPLAITGLPDMLVQKEVEAADLRVSAVLVKPFDLQEIREVLIGLGQGGLRSRPLPVASPSSPAQTEGRFERVAATMRGGMPLTDRLHAGLKELLRICEAEVGILFYLDPVSQRVSVVAQSGSPSVDPAAVGSLSESPVGDVILEQMEVFEEQVSQCRHDWFSKLLDLLPFESCIGLPVFANGDAQHAIFLFHRKREAFSRYRLRDARAMALLFSVVLERDALERHLQSASPILLSGQLGAGLAHEVYNRVSGLEIQAANLCSDLESHFKNQSSTQACPPASSAEIAKAAEQLVATTINLKTTVESLQRLMSASEHEMIEVNEVVRRAVTLLQPIARREGIRLETSLAPDLPLTVGSASRLQQVFLNTMLNGVQHTAKKMEQIPEGKGKVRVSTCLSKVMNGCAIQARFQDNGPGIHARQWESIFELGFSTRPGGTGVGLFLARGLVESMGGKILVEESLVPLGSTFLVELPVL